MDSLEEYVVNHSSCGMPRCEYVENGIDISCDECQKRMIAEHDAKIRAEERKKAEIDFQNSDYWNDYLGKVIADARADERREISEILNSPGDAETIVMMLTNYMVRHTIRDALKNKE